MQFSCDNCKSMLRIADEKVRGKRLVVRCKKCGAKITISDPALAGARPAPKLQPVALPAPQPAAQRAPQPAAQAAPQPAARTPPQPAARPAPLDAGSERDSDTESTRAMDSDLLERALRASKRDDAASVAISPNRAAPRPLPAPRAEGEPPRAALQRDPASWFAMLGGQQTGPLSRAEIGLKIDEGAVGPRTYVWKEGMDSWMRANDVAEVAALFVFAPEPEKIRASPPLAGAQAAVGNKKLSTQDPGAVDVSLPPDEARRTRERELQAYDFGSSDPGARLRAEAHSSPELEPDSPAAALRTPATDGSRTSPGKAASRGAPAAAASSQTSALEGAPRPPVATPVPGGDEPLRPLTFARDDEVATTNLDQLPPGEPVQQEDVAAERFNPGETAGPRVVDLARRASSGLGKQGPSRRDRAKAAPRADRFSQVPDSPELEERPKAGRTGEVLAFGGVQRSRAPLQIALIVGALLLAGALIWKLSSGARAPAKVETGAERTADRVKAPPGGTGDPSAAALLAQGPIARAPDERSGDKVARQPSDAPTSDQQADAKIRASEPGMGTRGPGAAQVAGTPAVESAKIGLTAADVRKKLAQSKGALQGCIDQALRREPTLRVGKIHIATTIAPSGSVTATKIDKLGVDQSPLGSCLKRATRRIVFPSFQGQALEVDIPIVVTAGE